MKIIFVLRKINIVLSLILQISLYSMRSYWGDINFNLNDLLGIRINFIPPILIITCIDFLMFIYMEFKKKSGTTYYIINWLNFTIFSGLLFYYIDQLEEEKMTMVQKTHHILSFISLVFTICLIILLWKLHISDVQRKIILASIILLIVQPYVLLPGNLYSEIPIKPIIIAHRGGSHIGPENTITAFEISHRYGVAGWEIDVRISLDGELFLMHDNDLRRTTNVDEVFPDRERDRPETFTLSELKQLNAGSWLLDEDPYVTVNRYIPDTDFEAIRNAKIPSIDEVIAISIKYKAIVDIDFQFPPNDHPYYGNYSDIVLNTFLNSSLPAENIYIFTSNLEIMSKAEKINPKIVTGWGIDVDNPPSPSDIKSNGFDGVNSHHSLSIGEIEKYGKEGLITNIWTVNNEFRFSQLWIAGASSIVTDIPNVFSKMIKPYLCMSKTSYYIFFAIFSTFELVALLVTYNKIRYDNNLND